MIRTTRANAKHILAAVGAVVIVIFAVLICWH